MLTPASYSPTKPLLGSLFAFCLQKYKLAKKKQKKMGFFFCFFLLAGTLSTLTEMPQRIDNVTHQSKIAHRQGNGKPERK
jgi:hypothetical protein